MRPLALALLALLLIVALRRREPDRAVMARRVWRRLEAQPGFNERIELGRAQIAARRVTRFNPDADTAACPTCDGEGLIQCHDFIGCLHDPHYDGYHLCNRCDGSGLQPSDSYPASLLR